MSWLKKDNAEEITSEASLVSAAGTTPSNAASGSDSLPRNAKLQYSEPLWKRVPTRDLKGKPYNDFMMIIPGLKHFESSRLQEIVDKVEAVLKHYEEDIILADLNLKINVLWVTLQPHIGLSTEIAALIHHVIPEAKLVSQHTAQAW